MRHGILDTMIRHLPRARVLRHAIFFLILPPALALSLAAQGEADWVDEGTSGKRLPRPSSAAFMLAATLTYAMPATPATTA
jgi:hypothetical protein